MNAEERRRYRRKLNALATVLIIAGLVVLIFLKRMPLPLRLLVGATDAIVGAVLLVVAKQKFTDEPSPPP